MLRTLIESVICGKKHLQATPFKIYSASAGSGKTYTLTKEYLKIILSSEKSYRKILAITFTNKAVNEMKQRILGSLHNFGQAVIPRESKNMFKEVCDELQIDSSVLRKRAEQALKQILHDYSYFDISTIDKFTQRLIRTFARDLRISQNFEVVLDTDLLLEEAVARLVDRAGSDKKLTGVLIDFSLEKIDDSKSWDVAYDLNQIGKLLFNETHSKHIKRLENKTIDDFIGLKEQLRNRMISIGKELVALASKALGLIASNGLEFKDFSSSYFPKFMLRIQNQDFNIDFNAGWKRNFDTNTLYNKSCDPETKTILDGLHSEFIALFNAIKKNHNNRSFLENVNGNIVPLTVLNEIQHEVRHILNERNQLSISEFNSIVSNEIKDQPAPFIYERLGEKYRHYFIDEFQDTSVMQWSNLVPLIGNAVESQDNDSNIGSLFLVGDGKQAIYRWRGGEAAQFLDIVNKKTMPFMVSAHIETLPINYRSHKEIVDFNNDFFMVSSHFLKNTVFRELFEFKEENKQLHTGKTGGQVQIDFIDSDNELPKEDAYCQKTLKTINAGRKAGYRLGDMAILVRDNKHGVLIAEFLTDNEINVISSDSLLLASSHKVLFLIDLLRYSIAPDDLQTGYGVLSFLAAREANRHAFIAKHLHAIDFLFRNEFEFDLQKFRHATVFNGLEYAIRRFRLIENSDAYITHLMDVVFEIEQKEGTGIATFLSYWEGKKGQLCISAPSTTDAIQIMSIHKAKGLEFNIVIYPFANSHIYKRNNKKLWIPVDKNDYSGFEELLINEKKEVVEYNETCKRIFTDEEHQMELDAFNVLYVALTRAVKALFVITEKDLTKNGYFKPEYYSGLFINYLTAKGLWRQDINCYTFGKLENFSGRPYEEKPEHVPYHYSYKDSAGFDVLAKSRMLWDTDVQKARTRGNLIHFVMGLIETRKDVPAVISALKQNGDISSDEIDFISLKIDQILKHPLLAKFYDKDFEVRNETDILTKDGRILRPDRIVFQGEKATLIDYKSGKKNPLYHEQIYTYADALASMGYEVQNKIIVYIDESITPEFI